eukprot:scaffold23772_cov63-Phaeocystis_antarctica.AAC.7
MGELAARGIGAECTAERMRGEDSTPSTFNSTSLPGRDRGEVDIEASALRARPRWRGATRLTPRTQFDFQRQELARLGRFSRSIGR